MPATGHASQARLPPGLSAECIQAQLERILTSRAFVHSERLQRFLRFVVEQTLQGRTENLKEFHVAVEVFDRKESYDPRIDSVVRVEARRLRSKLKTYYETHGRDDPVLIVLSEGSYIPAFRRREMPAARVERPASEAGFPAIAVLPFANMSSDPENEYFSDGLTEELINALAQVEGLRVVARTSAFQFKGKAYDVREIGEKLNAGVVLEGSVQRVGRRLRITAQLVSVTDGYHLWSERFDRELKDVFTIQDEISRAIVETLKIRLIGGKRLVKKSTETPEAYQLYLKGRYFCGKLTPLGLQRSIEYFNQAIAIDPSFAAPYSGLAEAYGMLAIYGVVAGDEGMPKAKAAALKALEMDDALADAHTFLGFVKSAYEWDWGTAEQEFQRAIALSPGSANAHHWYSAAYLTPLGRWEESLAGLRRALELDPVSLVINTSIGLAYHQQRQYDRAIEEYRKSLELDPSFYGAYWMLGLAYEQKSMCEEAIAALEKARGLAAEDTRIPGALGHCYALAGRRKQAHRVLEELEELSKRRHVSPYDIALVHVGLGDDDQSLAWLEKAQQARVAWMIQLGFDPRFDRLRSDRRFTALLQKMGLTPG